MYNKKENDRQKTYSFDVAVTDLQEFRWRVFRLELHQNTSEVVENSQDALKHHQTQELILQEGGDTEETLREHF